MFAHEAPTLFRGRGFARSGTGLRMRGREDQDATILAENKVARLASRLADNDRRCWPGRLNVCHRLSRARAQRRTARCDEQQQQVLHGIPRCKKDEGTPLWGRSPQGEEMKGNDSSQAASASTSMTASASATRSGVCEMKNSRSYPPCRSTSRFIRMNCSLRCGSSGPSDSSLNRVW